MTGSRAATSDLFFRLKHALHVRKADVLAEQVNGVLMLVRRWSQTMRRDVSSRTRIHG